MSFDPDKWLQEHPAKDPQGPAFEPPPPMSDAGLPMMTEPQGAGETFLEAGRRLGQAASPINAAKGMWDAVSNPRETLSSIGPRIAGPIAGAGAAIKLGSPAIIASGPWAPLTALGLGAFGATTGQQAVDLFDRNTGTFAEEADKVAGRLAENVASGTLAALPVGAGQARQAAAPKLRQIAEDRAVSTLQPTKAEARRVAQRNPNLGRTLLDEGTVPVLGSGPRVAQRVGEAKQRAGAEIGRLIKSADGTPVIDSAELARQVQPRINELRGVPGAEGAIRQMERQVETLRQNKVMSVAEAHRLRQQIDQSINWAKQPGDLSQTQGFLHDIRSDLSQRLNTAIDALDAGGPQNQLRDANRRFADLAAADSILERSVPRGQSNRTIGLTDTIAAGSGLAAGGVPLAAAAGAGNKFLRTYGDSIVARGADALAGPVRNAPPLQTLPIQQQPGREVLRSLWMAPDR